MSDLDAFSRSADPIQLFKLNQQLFDFREDLFRQMVDERLLDTEANRRGVSVAELLKGELPEPTVSDGAIEEAFAALAPQQTNGVTLSQARPVIERFLKGQAIAAARQRFIDTLRAEAKARGNSLVSALVPPRLDVPVFASDFKRGSGPIEVVEFGDFQCEFCAELQPVLSELASRYHKSVTLVWKDNPLPNHPMAVELAVAVRCAGEQGQFWKFSDAMFNDQGRLSSSRIQDRVRELGLDTRAFRICQESDSTRSAVEKTRRQAGEAGLKMTPVVFVNGRMIPGAAKREVYVRIIEDEIGRASRTE